MNKPCRTFPTQLATSSFISLCISHEHPACGCTATIFHYPFDDDPLEVELYPCEKDGQVHDAEALKSAARDHWNRINGCAQDFVIEHESHPEWEDDDEVVN